MQRLFFISCEFDAFAKTEILLQVAAHKIPRKLLTHTFAQLLQTCGVKITAHLLTRQRRQIQVVATIAQGDTTRFVVSSDENERFIGVLAIEFVSHANGFVSINHFAHHRRSVIVVTSPIYLTGFNHAEKLLRIFLLQESNRGSRDVGQSQIALLAVECIRDRGIVARIVFLVLQENHTVGFAILFGKFLVSIGNGKSLSACLIIQVGFSFVERSWFQKIATGEEIKVRCHQFTPNFCIHLAVFLVRIKTSWGGVINTHTRGDAHGSSCFFRPHRHRSHGGDTVGEHPNRVVVSFASCGECCSACCGVRDTVASTLRVHQRHVRE